MHISQQLLDSTTNNHAEPYFIKHKNTQGYPLSHGSLNTQYSPNILIIFIFHLGSWASFWIRIRIFFSWISFFSKCVISDVILVDVWM